MNKLYQLFAIGCILTGCAQRTAEWTNDPVTNGTMCSHMISPLETGNEKVLSELSLKKDLASGNHIIKATLTFIIMDYRDYGIENNEKLSINIDGQETFAEIVFSDKKAFEHFENRYVAMPNGHSLNLGTVQERTRKTITFKLTTDQLNALIKAKTAHFTISSSDNASRYVANVTTLNMNQLQNFKSVCYSTIGTKQ